MGNDEARALRQQGIAAAKAGQKDEARVLLQQAIRLEPGNEAAWMWLASVARDQRERVFALQKLLEINPTNETARQALDALQAAAPPAPAPGVRPIAPPAAPPSPAAQPAEPVQPFAFEPGAEAQAVHVPLPSAESVASAQKQADSLINGWLAAQAAPEIHWVHKTRGRAGESDIVRLRAQVGAVIVAALAVLVLVGALLVTTNEDVRSVVFAPTATYTLTPTATFTPTPGLTPTPSPEPRNPPTETPVPPFFMEGADLFNLPGATPVYPNVLSKPLEDAIAALDRGDVAGALPTLAAEVRQTDNEFKVQPYYYEAMAYLAQGELADARNVLDEAQERMTDRNTATDRALLASAEAQLAWAQARAAQETGERSEARRLLDEARDQAVAAIGSDAARTLDLNVSNSAPGDALLAEPYVVLSQVLRQERQYDEAIAILDLGLDERRRPSNVNLLVEKGRVYFDQRDYDLADTQAALALFVDPRTAAAHELRIAASLAQNEPGRAVLQAQDYLYYVPGSAEAWRLLGNARRAEGNDDLALLAYSQALSGDQPAVSLATLLSRAALFEQRREWDKAREDLTDALALQDSDAARVRRMIAAYYAGAYGTAQADAEALDGTNAMSGAELALWTARIGMAAADGDSSEPYRDALNRLSPLQDEDSGLEAEQRPLLFELLARAHLGSGSPDAALGFIDQALAAGETPTRHLIRGLIFEAQDEPEAARQEYDWVLSWDAIAPVAAADQAAERLRALND